MVKLKINGLELFVKKFVVGILEGFFLVGNFQDRIEKLKLKIKALKR
jgi:hypothetical protein